MSKSKVTIVIQVRNAANNIAACVESAKLLTRDIVVMDMDSTDGTREIARKAGATVRVIPRFPYVEPARNLAFEKISGEWVFVMDADERMTGELAEEIKAILEITPHSSFRVPRENIIAQKVTLRHGGWWPDHQIRLIKKTDFLNWPKEIHSTPNVRGSRGKLENPFQHYFHTDLESMVEKTANFEGREAALLYAAGRKVGVPTFFRKFLGELFRRLIKQKGFLDGAYGIIESFYQAYSKTITWILLYEKRNQK